MSEDKKTGATGDTADAADATENADTEETVSAPGTNIERANSTEPAEDADEGDRGTRRSDKYVKTKSWYSIPNAAWAVAVVALIVVGATGFWLGSRTTDVVSEADVNLAGAASGKAVLAPTPGEDGTFDANILGPRQGAQLTDASAADDLHRRNENDPFSIGAVDAPVVISIYSDFECPFCASYATQTEPQIVQKYVNNGLVRLEWNDMAINGDKAVKAAEAGRAAAAQGKFWQFANALYEKAVQRGSGHPEFTVDDLVATAEEVGVEDIDRFRDELDKGTYTEVVQQATGFASSLGISGTPAFVVGKEFISGAQPLDVFQDSIELALIQAKRAQNADK